MYRLSLAATLGFVALFADVQAADRCNPVQTARLLEQEALILEAKLCQLFAGDPCFVDLHRRASQIRVQGCALHRMLVGHEAGRAIRCAAEQIERDADRLEDAIDDQLGRRHRDCRRELLARVARIERLADDIEDAIDDHWVRHEYRTPVYRIQPYPLPPVVIGPTPWEARPQRPVLAVPHRPVFSYRSSGVASSGAER